MTQEVKAPCWQVERSSTAFVRSRGRPAASTSTPALYEYTQAGGAAGLSSSLGMPRRDFANAAPMVAAISRPSSHVRDIEGSARAHEHDTEVRTEILRQIPLR